VAVVVDDVDCVVDVLRDVDCALGVLAAVEREDVDPPPPQPETLNVVALAA